MINFSIQLFQLTKAGFQLWIVFATSTVMYLSHYYDVIVCIGVVKIQGTYTKCFFEGIHFPRRRKSDY